MRTHVFFLLLLFACGFWVQTGFGKSVNRSVNKSPTKQKSSSATTGKREEGDFVIEKRSDGTTVKYKKKNTYDFEGTTVEGMIKAPSGSYISNVKEVKGKSVIRVRENFDSEVIESARQLR